MPNTFYNLHIKYMISNNIFKQGDFFFFCTMLNGFTYFYLKGIILIYY